MQFLIIAVAVGTGVGVNTYMARKYALGRTLEADATAGTAAGALGYIMYRRQLKVWK